MQKIYKNTKHMNTAVLTIEDRIHLAENWILDSGIQSENGGFYAWQDMNDRSHSYLYSEITGYAITLMSFLYLVTKNSIFIEHAESAARWLIKNAMHPTGGVLTRDYTKDAVEHYSFERGNIYSFDCTIAAFGMLKIYAITRDKRYLKCAEDIADFLINKMLKKNNQFFAVFDTKNDRPYEGSEKWSTQSGSFHCKLVMFFCELSAVKKTPSFNNISKNLIDSSVKGFYKNGRFITNPADSTSHLHPYSYTLEGIVYYSYRTKDNSYKDIIEESFNRIVDLQDSNGGFPTQTSEDGRRDVLHQRCDIQAQILRLSYFIRSELTREKLLDRLSGFQNVSTDSRGGFLFGTDKDGSFKRHSNAWCSMFALQALYLVLGKINRETVLDYLV